MIVREIRLENVKSYGSPAEVIRLTPGVNAICGPNGAGKSTILEAIGCALFQYLPYKHEDFVREGQVTGTITVVVESRFDQRQYQVVRRIGRSPAHFVFDPDIGQSVARGEEDVRCWLRRHLQLSDDTHLPSLFLDSVGPPQGTLTAVFLQPATDRRSKFDRLLRVAEYQLAYQGLSALDGALDGERQELITTIAGLAGQLSGRAELLQRRSDLQGQQADRAVQLGRRIAERDALDLTLAEFERTAKAWQDAAARLDLAATLAQHATERRNGAHDLVAEAEGAAATVERVRPGRDAFLAAEASLRELEATRQERDRWLTVRNDRALKHTRYQAELDRILAEVERLEQAQQEIAALEARLPEQERAEQRREAVALQRQQLEERRQALPTLKDRLGRATSRLEAARQELQRLEALRDLANALPERQVRQREATKQLAAANQADGELRALRTALQAEQSRAATLRVRLTALAGVVAQAPAGDGPDLAALEASYQRAADERAAASSHLLHAQRTRGQVEGGLCPFLQEPCRNLRPGVTLAAHFDGEITRWSSQAQQLNAATGAAELALKQARELQERRERAIRAREESEELSAELSGCETRLASTQEQIRTVARLASARSEAERAANEAASALRHAERAQTEVSRLAGVQQQVQEAAEDCDATVREYAAAQEQLKALPRVEEELREATAALNALGNPRARAANLRQQLDQLPTLLARRQKGTAVVAQAERELGEAEAALVPFADLDERLATLQAQRDACQGDYETYLAKLPLAETLPVRRAALATAEAEARAAAEARDLAQAALDAAERAYDAEAHQAGQRRRSALDQAVGELQAGLTAGVEEEARLQRALEQLDRLAGELAERQIQVERLNGERQVATALRQAIRAAGPDITRQLLKRISRTATRINADILNQSGVEIEWTTDYEILTRRQGETRSFAQLSGGEQMAAALAVRLAVLRDLSNVRIAFLDEPTAHLDQERRSNLGDQVQRLQGFDQLVVISHDDTFDGLFGHVVRVGHQDGRSRIQELS
jgi:exonuclease SbcC